MRTKFSSFFRNLPQRTQRPNLKTTRVGKQRSPPSHKTVQSTTRTNHIDSGTQPKVIGVTENNARIDFSLECFEANALHRARSSNRHENRRLNYAAASS